MDPLDPEHLVPRCEDSLPPLPGVACCVLLLTFLNVGYWVPPYPSFSPARRGLARPPGLTVVSLTTVVVAENAMYDTDVRLLQKE